MVHSVEAAPAESHRRLAIVDARVLAQGVQVASAAEPAVAEAVGAEAVAGVGAAAGEDGDKHA